MLRLKRAYDKREPADGKRILVDRLWPRGLSREEAAVDEWMKDLAPSDGLRRWFGHETEKWPEFRRRYSEELASPDKAKLLEKLAGMATAGPVTLVYAARDQEHNNAKVLAGIILDSTKGKRPQSFA